VGSRLDHGHGHISGGIQRGRKTTKLNSPRWPHAWHRMVGYGGPSQYLTGPHGTPLGLHKIRPCPRPVMLYTLRLTGHRAILSLITGAYIKVWPCAPLTIARAGHAIRLFQGWPPAWVTARRADCLRQSSTPMDTPWCTPLDLIVKFT
jgi:hypothetical protein